MKLTAITLTTLLFFSCTTKNNLAPTGTTEAYVPVYASATMKLVMPFMLYGR